MHLQLLLHLLSSGRRTAQGGPLIVTAAAGLMLLARRVLLYVRVEGDSMRPVLADGDRVLALRSPPARVTRGAVVVGRSPTAAGDPPIRFIVRGHSGEVVVLHDEHSDFFVKRVTGVAGDRMHRGVRVPAGSYFVEGSAIYSVDSRVWGPVAGERILGRVLWRMRRGRRTAPR